MAYNVKILADSISPDGVRLTTLEATYWRAVHAEMLTHRMFSRNAASSRAIPVAKLIEKVEAEPFIPEYWGANQPGMQAERAVSEEAAALARDEWLTACRQAVRKARTLSDIGVHKQLVNRLLEPFQWYTSIITATEWSNFFALRCHPDAQPEIQRIAVMMRDALAASTPKPVAYGEWHLPLTPDLYDLQVGGYSLEDIKKVSAGRCARVSYLTHHGERNPQADIELCERLVASGHMSPLEHVATPALHFHEHENSGNLMGWVQMRKAIPHEEDFSKRPVTMA